MNKKKVKKMTNEKMAKIAMGASCALLIALAVFFGFFNEEDISYKKIAAENYYNYTQGKSDFKSEVMGQKSPYLLFHSIEQYKKTNDAKKLELIASAQDRFFSEFSKILLADKMIGEEKFEQAESYLNSIKTRKFLPLKYYFSGFLFESKNEIEKAKSYYDLVLKLKESESFIKELASLRIQFLR